VRQAQYEALKVVNTQLIHLYWEIGKSIAEKQGENWGKAIVPKLSKELQNEFPGIGGFSTTNLWLMAQFYSEYQDVEGGCLKSPFGLKKNPRYKSVGDFCLFL
jgi:hypothetical protein